MDTRPSPPSDCDLRQPPSTSASLKGGGARGRAQPPSQNARLYKHVCSVPYISIFSSMYVDLCTLRGDRRVEDSHVFLLVFLYAHELSVALPHVD